MDEAGNGQEAPEKLEQIHPDIVLLDINMPVMDGFAAISTIREQPSLATLPVLEVTAYAMRGDREKILRSGFDGYLEAGQSTRTGCRARSYPFQSSRC